MQLAINYMLNTAEETQANSVKLFELLYGPAESPFYAKNYLNGGGIDRGLMRFFRARLVKSLRKDASIASPGTDFYSLIYPDRTRLSPSKSFEPSEECLRKRNSAEFDGIYFFLTRLQSK